MLRSVETGLIAYQMFRAAVDFLGTLHFVDCGLGPADLAVWYSKAWHEKWPMFLKTNAGHQVCDISSSKWLYCLYYLLSSSLRSTLRTISYRWRLFKDSLEPFFPYWDQDIGAGPSPTSANLEKFVIISVCWIQFPASVKKNRLWLVGHCHLWTCSDNVGDSGTQICLLFVWPS